jgi:hypothetical protein
LPRTIDIFIRDRNGRLITESAEIEFLLDGQPGYKVENAEGRGRVENVPDDVSVTVSAIYRGERKSAKLASAQNTFTFTFDADVGPSDGVPRWLPPTAFGFGVIFMAAILVLIIRIPNPTTPQFYIFRIVIALAGAAFAMALTGFVAVRIEFSRAGYVVAGGSLAVFVILFFFSPAMPLLPAPKRFSVCEDFYKDNTSLTSYLNNPNVRFTGTCRSIHFSSCLAFDERHDTWDEFRMDCPGAAMYSVARADGSCCDTFAFKGEGFTGKSGYYCCY